MTTIHKQQNTSALVEQVWLHDHQDPHHGEFRLADVILGGQDGLVNVLGVILGVAAATQDVRIVIAAGLAATFAESISMGAVAYTSTLAENDLYHSEREREYRHIHLAPDVEVEEIRGIYQKKGFEGETLDKIVEVITSNPDVWVDVMMAEEFQLIPPEKSKAFRSALLVGFSALIGSFIPLFPFFFWTVNLSIGLSISHRRSDLVHIRYVQSPRHGRQALPQRYGDGDHRHIERAGRLCGGIDIQSTIVALTIYTQVWSIIQI